MLVNASTQERLRIYPRLVLIVMAGVLLYDFLAAHGWQGGLGQIVGSDFVTLYAALQAYREGLSLYDWNTQYELQSALIAPTPLSGVNPFISPPYVAQAYALLTALPLPWALAIWLFFSLLCIGAAVYLLSNVSARNSSLTAQLSPLQLIAVLLSSFAFVTGFRVGQNHALTLLLVVAVCVAIGRERWGIAGALAGLLLYKPQFALGFALVWLVWRRFAALLAFGAVALSWAGSVLVTRGPALYREYWALQGTLLRLPYVSGFPSYIFVTPYGLLTTLLPESALPWIQYFTQLIALVLGAFLAAVAYRWQRMPVARRGPVLALALLFPLLTMPYTLLHDLLLLAPALILAAQHPQVEREPTLARRLIGISVGVYIGMLFLTLIGYAVGVALTALLPLAVFGVLWGWCWRVPA